MRLLSYTDLGSASGVANPVNYAAASPAVERHVFRFGARQTPYEFDPAWDLARMNSEHYGAPLPKGWVCLDLVKENGPRDTLVMPGVTDPEWVTDIADGTVLAANARTEIVQELLFANQAFV